MSSSLRLDRLLTLYVVHPLMRAVGATRRFRVPILMYHSISDEPRASSSYYGVTTGPATFAAHMRFLKDEGYHVLTMERVVEMLAQDAAGVCDGRCVAITFDDGYRDNYTNALPILKERGFPATVYLVTACIGDTRQKFKGRECLTWAEVIQMQREGMAFGSHTVNHPRLSTLDDDGIRREIRESRDTIEQKLGARVTEFAYPYAFPESDLSFVARIRNLVGEAGYTSNVTTVLGRVRVGDDPLLLKRLPVNEGDDVASLHAKLKGAYDWLHCMQVTFKRLKK